jgi:uncharacterized spore protein YtfJ
MRNIILLSALLLARAIPAAAQAPLAKPLAEFDRLVAQLKTASVIGEPIAAGGVTILPFAEVHFALAGAGAAIGAGGGLSSKTVPLGMLVIEGDDVRLEQYPVPQETPPMLSQLLQAILDRKVVFMGNGLNIGNASGNIQDLAPLISAMMGQTTFIGQPLNLGNLKPPAPAAPPKNAPASKPKPVSGTR